MWAVLKSEAKPDAATEPGPSARVRFSKSGAAAEWSRAKGTLLELAESIGLAPKFGWRSGICGTCTTRINSGAVEYLEEPVAPRSQGEVLICCSVPRVDPGHDVWSGEGEVVLDL
jgi:uncharacterized protein